MTTTPPSNLLTWYVCFMEELDEAEMLEEVKAESMLDAAEEFVGEYDYETNIRYFARNWKTIQVAVFNADKQRVGTVDVRCEVSYSYIAEEVYE